MFISSDLIQNASVATASASDAADPTLRVRPRVAVATGEIAGHAMTFSTSLPQAIDAACKLAHVTGAVVSIPVRSRLADLPDLTIAALAHFGLRPNMLEFAVGTTTLRSAGVDGLVALSALRDRGVGVSLGGFAGLDLGVLSRLPLSSVILAAPFVRDLQRSPAALGLLTAIVGTAHAQGLTVTATGVETESQRAVLSGFGCDHGEGELFGPFLSHREAALRVPS